MWTQRVVAHPQPPGRVDGGHVPPRLHLLVGVDRLEQLLKPPVAARRRPHAGLGDRLAGRDRLLVRPDRPSRLGTGRLQQEALADSAEPDPQRRGEPLGRRLQDQQPGRQQAHPLDV